jgi:MFS family permease
MEAARPRMPAAVWALGFVSLLMDVSSEIVHALLPVYLVAVLGAGMATVGLIEGIAESTASVVKVFSGVLSDRMGRRKALALAGYGLAALTKPVFPLATSVEAIVAARFVDRIGKGIRGAPRDALVADMAPPEIRGAAFGLRQTLDTMGAVLGPAAAIVIMALSGDDYALAFWAATVPAFACVALLALAVREPDNARPNPDARLPIRRADLAALGGAYWAVVGIAVAFSAARIGEAFLIVRAVDLGLTATLAPAVLVAMNVAYALTSYPAGRLSDRIGRRGLLAAGFAVFVAADLALALAQGLPGVFVGIVLWGVHMGLTQGLLSILVADVAPERLRGTAFGAFNLAQGLALLAGNFAGGLAWSRLGAPAAFGLSAALTFAALAGFAGLTWIKRPAARRG